MRVLWGSGEVCPGGSGLSRGLRGDGVRWVVGSKVMIKASRGSRYLYLVIHLELH